MRGGFVGEPEAVGVDRSGLDGAIGLLEGQCARGLQGGAQLFVARKGRALLDVAIGEARPGVPMETDSVLLWGSATKPLTAVAIAQQLERGKLRLEDRVQRFIPEFANGKESATIKHVLTHTGGFPMNSVRWTDYSWDAAVSLICEEPAQWEPGSAAGYHGHSGWIILGEIVRRIDGRPIERYLEEEIFRPLGMVDSSIGISDSRAAELGDRLVLISRRAADGRVLREDHANTPESRRCILPGGWGRGPAHDWGRFYLALWNGGEREGTRVLRQETVALFTATHRRGMIDRTFSLRGAAIVPPWGLGFVKGSDEPASQFRVQSLAYGRQCTAGAFGHSGGGVATAFVEPSRDLVVAMVTDRRDEGTDNTYRFCEVSDAIHSACR